MKSFYYSYGLLLYALYLIPIHIQAQIQDDNSLSIFNQLKPAITVEKTQKVGGSYLRSLHVDTVLSQIINQGLKSGEIPNREDIGTWIGTSHSHVSIQPHATYLLTHTQEFPKNRDEATKNGRNILCEISKKGDFKFIPCNYLAAEGSESQRINGTVYPIDLRKLNINYQDSGTLNFFTIEEFEKIKNNKLRNSFLLCNKLGVHRITLAEKPIDLIVFWCPTKKTRLK